MSNMPELWKDQLLFQITKNQNAFQELFDLESFMKILSNCFFLILFVFSYLQF